MVTCSARRKVRPVTCIMHAGNRRGNCGTSVRSTLAVVVAPCAHSMYTLLHSLLKITWFNIYIPFFSKSKHTICLLFYALCRASFSLTSLSSQSTAGSHVVYGLTCRVLQNQQTQKTNPPPPTPARHPLPFSSFKSSPTNTALQDGDEATTTTVTFDDAVSKWGEPVLQALAEAVRYTFLLFFSLNTHFALHFIFFSPRDTKRPASSNLPRNMFGRPIEMITTPATRH